MRNFALAAAAGLIAAAAGLLPGATDPVRADVIRLENGKVMHGTVDRSWVDRDFMRVQLFSTGGVVRVRWDHLIREDRDQWQQDLGLKESKESLELKVEAHRFWVESRPLPRFGLILNPADLEKQGTEIKVLSKGATESFPRAMIVRVEPFRLDLALVFTPRQAYERRRDELNPVTGLGHAQLADYARLVGAYEEAKEHYLEAKKDADYAGSGPGKALDSKLATLDVLIRNRSLQQELDKVRVTLLEARTQSEFAKGAEFFLRARETMFRIQTEVTDKKVRQELKIDALAQSVDAERRKFFQARLFGEWKKRVQAAAYAKATERKIQDIPPGTDRAEAAEMKMKGTFEGAKNYFSRKAKDDIETALLRDSGASKYLEELKELMEKAPEKLTEADQQRMKRLITMEKMLKAEMEDYWTNRAKGAFVVTTYGNGTFIVTGNQLTLKRKPPAKGSGGSSAKKPAQQAQDVVRTPEQWWEEAPVQERVNWLLCWFAEKAQKFETLKVWDDDCTDCSGLGYKKSSAASTGEEEVTRCVTCNGAKVKRKVRWK